MISQALWEFEKKDQTGSKYKGLQFNSMVQLLLINFKGINDRFHQQITCILR